MTGTTSRLAVFGNPVAHSRSPDIHAMFGQQKGIDLRYEKVEVPAGAFDATAKAFLEDGLGFNVTLPCKHEAYEFAEVTGEEAQTALAVNTVSRQPDGRIRGDNTDGPGLVKDLESNLEWSIEAARILVLGAGGAVSGVLDSLARRRPSQLHVLNRTHDKALALAARFDGVEAISRDELSAGYDLIINGTSAGLTVGAGKALFPAGIVDNSTRCYDMLYGAGHAAFRQWCMEQADCQVADGLGMLVEQAALSFGIWFNQSVDTNDVIKALRSSL